MSICGPSIHPVAVILHLEFVSLHHNGCGDPRHDRVLQRTDFKDGLPGTDDFRKIAFLPLAIDMHNLDRLSNHALKRMQDTNPLRLVRKS
jgi:hypothetical protein